MKKVNYSSYLREALFAPSHNYFGFKHIFFIPLPSPTLRNLTHNMLYVIKITWHDMMSKKGM